MSFLRRARDRRGVFLPLVLVGVVVVALIFIAFFRISVSSRKKVSWNEDRLKARYVAEAGLAAAAAAIFQNDFEARWYKKGSPNGKYGGFSGECSGTYGGGTYRVVAEDVVHLDGAEYAKLGGQDAQIKFLQEATYERIDLFCEGTYGSYTVVAYQALALLPEEPVYRMTNGGHDYVTR